MVYFFEKVYLNFARRPRALPSVRLYPDQSRRLGVGSRNWWAFIGWELVPNLSSTFFGPIGSSPTPPESWSSPYLLPRPPQVGCDHAG